MEQKQTDKIFVSSWTKKHGKLEFSSKQEESLFHALTRGMRENQKIYFMIDFADDNGTLQQIAKLKAGTRDIAKESGHSFIEVEQEIKKNAGLFDENTGIYKSFGNCSREQLSSSIQVMINIGETIGLNLK